MNLVLQTLNVELVNLDLRVLQLEHRLELLILLDKKPFFDLQLLQPLDVRLQFLLDFVPELLDQLEVREQGLLKNAVEEGPDFRDHVAKLVSVAFDLLRDLGQAVASHIKLLKKRLKVRFVLIKAPELDREVEVELFWQLEPVLLGLDFAESVEGWGLAG